MTPKKQHKKRPTLKEKYELWWDYLTASNKYQEFCDIMRKSSNKAKSKTSKSDDWQNLYKTWQFFGDVFKDDFDTWWEKKNKRKESVIDLRATDVKDKIPTLSSDLMRLNISKDNITDVRKIFKNLFRDSRYIFVAIPVDNTMKQISTEIKVIKDRWIKNASKKTLPVQIHQLKFSGRVRVKELYEYLETYMNYKDAMKTAGIKSIIDALYYIEGSSSIEGAAQRKFYRYISKASQIIENVEAGTFPGKYH